VIPGAVFRCRIPRDLCSPSWFQVTLILHRSLDGICALSLLRLKFIGRSAAEAGMTHQGPRSSSTVEAEGAILGISSSISGHDENEAEITESSRSWLVQTNIVFSLYRTAGTASGAAR